VVHTVTSMSDGIHIGPVLLSEIYSYFGIYVFEVYFVFDVFFNVLFKLIGKEYGRLSSVEDTRLHLPVYCEVR
jgi:hypothetical protein